MGISILISGCKTKNTTEVLAEIGSYKITKHEVDSILEPQFNNLRSQVIDAMISRKIIETEAVKNRISPEEYVEQELDLAISNMDSMDEEKYNMARHNHFESLIDSLKNEYYIKYYLNPFNDPSKFFINYRGNLNSQNSLIVISDFDCPACKWYENQLFDVYKEYSKFFKFGYIFYSDHVSLASLSMIAANNQNKIWEMYDSLFSEKIRNSSDTTTYIDIAEELDLNITDFISDLRNKDNAKLIQQNINRLSSYSIRQTPTFVLNNKILPDGIKIDSLKQLIKNSVK